MRDEREWVIPVIPVREADARARASAPALTHSASLSDDRVTELRCGIASGYYASASMMDAIARRLLDSGDL